VSGAEEQLGGPGRLACAQLQLQRGMYVRCTNIALSKLTKCPNLDSSSSLSTFSAANEPTQECSTETCHEQCESSSSSNSNSNSREGGGGFSKDFSSSNSK
jgi:hypothetical protein